LRKAVNPVLVGSVAPAIAALNVTDSSTPGFVGVAETAALNWFPVGHGETGDDELKYVTGRFTKSAALSKESMHLFFRIEPSCRPYVLLPS
jgi:hypothetical protein